MVKTKTKIVIKNYMPYDVNVVSTTRNTNALTQIIN